MHLNSVGLGNPVKRTCSTCHGMHMTGMDVANGWMDIGTTNLPWARESPLNPWTSDTPQLPLFKITCNADVAPHVLEFRNCRRRCAATRLREERSVAHGAHEPKRRQNNELTAIQRHNSLLCSQSNPDPQPPDSRSPIPTFPPCAADPCCSLRRCSRSDPCRPRGARRSSDPTAAYTPSDRRSSP